MSKRGFKELRVWQKGKNLAVYVYRITNIQKEIFKEIEKGGIEISRMLSNSKLISARSKPFCPSHLPFILSLWIK
jgi:hypothetical protein